MKINSIEQLKTKLVTTINNSKSSCILTHVRPDGDGLAAALALKEFYPQLRIILEEPNPGICEFLSSGCKCEVYSDEMQFDLVIILDCHEEERVGKCKGLLPKAKDILIIDHHLDKDIIPNSDYYINANKVSVGAIIFNLFENDIAKQSPESQKYIADALYVTILNDTSNFVNANVDEEAYTISSKLLKFGLKPSDISVKFLMNKSADEIRLVGEILSTTETYHNESILFIHCTREMLKHNNATEDSTEKITTYVKGTRDVKVVVFFLECPDEYRLSLRSDAINVNKIAVKFGGGGHKKASGCPMNGTLEENKSAILTEIRKQL